MKARFAAAQALGWEQVFARGLTANKTLATRPVTSSCARSTRKRAA
jgi:hypothetical protein